MKQLSSKAKNGINVAVTVLFITALVILLLTFAIGVPIHCRFFYYIQINTLSLPKKTGWSYEVIKEAYDDILNFCTLPYFPCKTGQLKLSQSGAEHFADCKALFVLNDSAFSISALTISIILFIKTKYKSITLLKPFGLGAWFLSAVIAVALPIILILLVFIVGFESAFNAFHAVFFPGKTNWQFSPIEDQIINVMPQEFFMNCAIIIAVTLITLSATIIVVELIRHGRAKNKIENK